MAPLLPLTVDELLTTTRTVRKRLDLSRPVEREVIMECLAVAQQAPSQSAMWGSIGPAVWNFMLAARARGLGTAWTSFHRFFEEDAAQILNIPYAAKKEIKAEQF